jgi:hypothetical protein
MHLPMEAYWGVEVKFLAFHNRAGWRRVIRII